MLTLYRRHLDSCPQADKGRAWKRCKCPIWVDGTHIGMEVRKSLKTTSWDDAERKLAELKETPAFSFEQPKTVEQAVTAYMSDARSGQKLSDDTLRKKRNVLRPLIQFCTNKGKLYLKQITLEDLVGFRETWKDEALSASKKLERMKGFFRFCVNMHWLKESPAVHLKRPKIPTFRYAAFYAGADVGTVCRLREVSRQLRPRRPNARAETSSDDASLALHWPPNSRRRPTR